MGDTEMSTYVVAVRQRILPIVHRYAGLLTGRFTLSTKLAPTTQVDLIRCLAIRARSTASARKSTRYVCALRGIMAGRLISHIRIQCSE